MVNIKSGPWSVALVAACVVGAVFACDRDVPDALADRPELTIVQTIPEPMEKGFALERAMRLRFDRYLKPASVVRQSVLVTAALFDPDSGAAKGAVYFFEPVYDPYERMVVFQLAPGARWVPSTLHQVRLLKPRDENAVVGFQAFDGTPLNAQKEFSFTTGDSVSDPNDDVDDFRPTIRFCQTDDLDEASRTLPAAFEVLHQRCASAGCHGVGGDDSVFGLNLSSPANLRATAIRVVARQTLTGPSVGALSANPRRFGDDMPRIDPGNAGNSYLVYKLLVNPDNHPGQEERGDDPWLGGLPPPGPAPVEELSRLRSWFVRGEPMPPQANLSPDEMRAIVRWIMQGAPAPDCP